MSTITPTAPTRPPTDRMLAYARRQADPDQLDITDGDAVPGSVPLPRADRQLALDRGLHHLLDLPFDAARGPRTRRVDDPWSRVQAVLTGTFGIQRWEPTHPYNGHRAYPSARGAFTTHAVLLDPGGRPWHLDPNLHALVALGEHDGPSIDAHVRAGKGVTVAILGCDATLPPGYGELRYPLVLLEAGHALATATTVATAVGAPWRVRLGFDDAALLGALGADPSDGWTPIALLDLEAHADGAPPTLPAASHHRPIAIDPDADAWLVEPRAGSWPPALAGAPRPVHGGSGSASVDVPPTSEVATPLAEVLFRRSAGRARTGASARPEPLPVGAIGDFLAATGSSLQGGSPTAGHAGLRCFVAVERTAGLDDGLYEWRPPHLLLRRRGRLMAEVAASFSYPADWVRVDTFNQAWFLVCDYGDVIDRLGPRGFRLSQVEVGAVAQSLALAATVHGAFARPCRSFHHAGLAELLHLEPTESVAYEVLVGRDRFTDLLLDVRP